MVLWPNPSDRGGIGVPPVYRQERSQRFDTWRHITSLSTAASGPRAREIGVFRPDAHVDLQQVDIYGPARAVEALERKNTFRDRSRHLSDLSVKGLPPFGP
jgi:hypothetical protein